MPFDHKQQLSNFLNGLVAKGTAPAKVEELRTLLTSDDTIAQYLSEGTLGQSEVSRRLGEVQGLERTLQTKQQEWTTYLSRAEQTLAASERDRLVAERKVAAAETAMRSIGSQYNISEDEIATLYNPSTFDAARGRVDSLPVPGQVQPRQPGNGNGNGTLTREDIHREMYGLVKDIAKKDSISARHFELTSKPWDSSKALSYIEQQAALGNVVQIEDAWRITENIDVLEAARSQADKEAERTAMREEVRAELAAANQGSLPNDPNPDFGSAHIHALMETTPEGQVKEPTGHYARTQQAVKGLHALQQARRMGTKSPYDEQGT